MDKRGTALYSARDDHGENTLALGELVRKLQSMQRSHSQLAHETQKSMAELQSVRQIDKKKLEMAQFELDQEKKANASLKAENRKLVATIDSLKKSLEERHDEIRVEARLQETHELIEKIVQLNTEKQKLEARLGRYCFT